MVVDATDVGRPGALRGHVRLLARALFGDSLYRNSVALIVNTAVTACFGLAFWTLASRTFSPHTIGVVAAIVGGITLASTAAQLGMPNTVMRFVAGVENQRGFVVVASMLVLIAGAAIGTAWAVIPGHLGTPLDAIGGVPLVVALLATTICVAALDTLADFVIIALRRSPFLLVENVTAGIAKVAFIPLGAPFGARGLFGAYLAGMLVATATSVGVVAGPLHLRGGPRDRARDRALLRRRGRFATGNYVATLAAVVPAAILPALATARLGATQGAYVAIPLFASTLLNSISAMTAQSLFAEASHDERALGYHVRRALLGIYAVLVPVVVLVLIAAPAFLGIFGPGYARHGSTCLRLLAVAALPAGFSYVGDVVLNAKQAVGAYVFVNVAGTVAILAALAATAGYGVTGIGIGWLIGQIAYAVAAAAALYATGITRYRRTRRTSRIGMSEAEETIR